MAGRGVVSCGASLRGGPLADEVGEHDGDVGFGKGDVFAGGGGDERAGGVLDLATGFVDAVAAIGDEFSGDEEFFVRRGGAGEADGEFRAVGEASGGDGTGPDHDFIEDGAEDAAVNGVAETDVFGAGSEAGVGEATVGGEAEAEAEGVGFAADEAGAGMGQGLHGWGK